MTNEVVQLWPRDRCPACLGGNTCALGDDTQLCFDCRHEWQPSQTHGPDPDAYVLALDDEPERGVPEHDDEPEPVEGDPIATARDELVGREAIHFDSESRATITDIDEQGVATLTFGSGYEVFAYPDEFDVLPAVAVDDTTIAAFAETTLTTAARIVFAAVESFTVTDNERRIGVPPEGYLENDPELFWIVEGAAAQAVAGVAYAFGITTEQLRDIATQWTSAAHAAEERSTQ